MDEACVPLSVPFGIYPGGHRFGYRLERFERRIIIRRTYSVSHSALTALIRLINATSTCAANGGK